MDAVRLLLVLSISLVLAFTVSPAGSPAPVHASSDIFGDGSDGPKTYSVSTIDAPIDSPASGAAGTNTLSATNPGFVAGHKILIHQSRGSGAGSWELNEIQAYSAGMITTVNPLASSYTSADPSRAQVLVVPEYTDLTVNAGVTVNAKVWNGSAGGIFAVLVNGTATISGTLTASGGGYRGGARGTLTGSAANNDAMQGEGTPGPGCPANATSGPNGNGGEPGDGLTPLGGGGGGNGTAGGSSTDSGIQAQGGSVAGSDDLAVAAFGGGGGGTASTWNVPSSNGADGGSGGGIVIVYAAAVAVNPGGSVTANGQPGGNGNHGAGGGAGGSILLKGQAITIGSGSVTATGGAGGLETPGSCCTTENGGAGGAGRIRVEYACQFSGTTVPPASVGTLPGEADADGLTNAQEALLGTDPCNTDTDGDGCADSEEPEQYNADPNSGGRRNPLDPWDFYDVPTGMPPAKNKSIDLDDTFAVLEKFGSHPTNPPNAPPYDPEYDRSSPTPFAWSTRDPAIDNNGVQLDEVFWNLDQFGHSCFPDP